MSESTKEQNSAKKPSCRKYLIAAGCIVLLIISALVFSLFQEEPKPDPSSETLIRELVAKQLNKNPNDLTNEDFAKIRKLTTRQSTSHESVKIKISKKIELSDIILIEKFVNLEDLQLIGISYPEKNIPKYMKILGELGIVNIKKKYAIDLSPLKKLNHLNNLELSGSSVKNIKYLSSVSSLQHLGLNYTMISDLRPLKDLKILETLNLNNTNISNIKPLNNLTNLNFIDLSNTKISDLEPLKDLIKLETLILNSTRISSIESLKNLKNLQKLSIINCPNITSEQIEGLKEINPELKVISIKEKINMGF